MSIENWLADREAPSQESSPDVSNTETTAENLEASEDHEENLLKLIESILPSLPPEEAREQAKDVLALANTPEMEARVEKIMVRVKEEMTKMRQEFQTAREER